MGGWGQRPLCPCEVLIPIFMFSPCNFAFLDIKNGLQENILRIIFKLVQNHILSTEMSKFINGTYFKKQIKSLYFHSLNPPCEKWG